LSAILHDRHALPTTAFHLGEEYTAIEVAGPVPDRERLLHFETQANAEIRANRAVRTREVEPEDLAQLKVRTRGLPEGHSGPVRLVEIDGIDLNTCGGTHVSGLAELQLLHVLDASPARGVTRIRFLAGGRTQRELRRMQRMESDLQTRLGTGPDEFAAVLDGWQSERKRSERRVRELETSLAEARGAEIAAGTERILCARVAGFGPDALRRIAAAVLARRPDAVVVLVGEVADSGEPCLVVESGQDGPPDVGAIGQQACEALGARGGGKGRRFQGRGGRFSEAVFAVFRDH
jgi:alanyl-tRNA synthetase